MLIAHVVFSVSPENRTQALDALTQEVPVVSAMKGCLAFVPFPVSTNDGEVGVLHEWEAAEDFAAYISSESFKTMGETLRPIMTAPPVSKRFDAKLIDT